MKIKVIAASFLILCINLAINSQSKRNFYDKDPLEKNLGLADRAGGAHNINKIGLFFENRGKLYPRRITQGPSGEYPINSGRHYIYRLNPMVGIPGNVIQGRFTTNEEWEAVGGFHNPEKAKIAFSDDPKSWHPENGWPVKDANGNPIFISDQDSYCVYDDAANSRTKLNIEVHQKGYAFGSKLAENIIFFEFLIINKGTQNLDKLYFAMYTDIDVGNISGGIPEYADDKIGFEKDKNLLYFYDADNFSSEWPGNPPGYMGISFLKTPKVNDIELGVTDMHYNLYDDDSEQDTILYGIMSSSQSLYNSSLGPRYFHLGTPNNIHFDDPATIPANGLDIVAMISSGPYNLNVNDTLKFITALVAGDNYEQLIYYWNQANNIVKNNFALPRPPATPKLSGYAGDGYCQLYWDDAAEKSKDAFSGEYDFEGYKLYRSSDRGLTWTLLKSWDVRNNIGSNTGLEYSYRDTAVVNGFEYWYTITSYDRGSLDIESLESPKGNTPQAPNLKILSPKFAAIGYKPISLASLKNIGKGISNYYITLYGDQDAILNQSDKYEVRFCYLARTTKGKLNTKVDIEIIDSSKTQIRNFGIEFLSKNSLRIVDLSTLEIIGPDPRNYQNTGTVYTLSAYGIRFRVYDPDPNASLDLLPKLNDYITLYYSIYVVKNGTDTVINPRPFEIGKYYSTKDGIIFSINKPNAIQNFSKISGVDQINFEISVVSENQLVDSIFILQITNKGISSSGGFIGLEIKNYQNGTTVYKIDTLYNNQTFLFKGLSFRAKFNSNSPPAAGNAFLLSIINPKEPNLRDVFELQIQEASFVKSEIKSKLKDIKVVPNPYIVSSLYEPEFGQLRREPLRQIKFINLPPQCEIYIFSIDADLVKKISHDSFYGEATWDLRSESGREIAPGVYIFIVKSSVGEYKGKFAVIK